MSRFMPRQEMGHLFPQTFLVLYIVQAIEFGKPDVR